MADTQIARADKESKFVAGDVRLLFDYDPITRMFVWRRRADDGGRGWNKKYAGKVAGTTTGKGYRRISICGTKYFVHRLAWAYMTGAWPADGIDHKDTDKENNAFSNLREATKAENMWNCDAPVTNTSGHKGVSWHKLAKKWQATIRADGRRIHLGYFVNINEAVAAYANTALKYHGEFTRVT